MIGAWALGLAHCELRPIPTPQFPIPNPQSPIPIIPLNKVLKNQYSKKFIDLVGLLLEIHEKNRPDFIHLEEIMKGWENNE